MYLLLVIKIRPTFIFFIFLLSLSSFSGDNLSMEQYKDPVSETLELHSNYAFDAGIDLKIFSSTGKMVIHKTLLEDEHIINVAKLNTGIYYGVFIVD